MVLMGSVCAENTLSNSSADPVPSRTRDPDPNPAGILYESDSRSEISLVLYSDQDHG